MAQKKLSKPRRIQFSSPRVRLNSIPREQFVSRFVSHYLLLKMLNVEPITATFNEDFPTFPSLTLCVVWFMRNSFFTWGSRLDGGWKKIPKNPLHDGIDDVTQSSGDIFFFIFSLWLRNSINSPTQHATESILEAFLKCSITQVIHCKTLLTWLSATHQLWPLSLTQLANLSSNRRFFTDFFRAKTSNRHSN